MQVGVDGNDRIAFGCIEASSKGGLLAEVPRELDDRETRVAVDERDQSVQGVVPAAVIHADNFEADIRDPVEHAAKGLVERVHGLALVVEGATIDTSLLVEVIMAEEPK